MSSPVDARPAQVLARDVRIEPQRRCRACAPGARAARCPPVATTMFTGIAAASRVAVDGVRERPTQLEVGRRRVVVVEREVARPAGRPERASGDLRGHEVREAWRVSHGDHVQLIVRVRLERLARPASARTRRAPTFPGGRPRSRRCRSSTSRSSRALGDAERTAHHLAPGLRPLGAVALDRVPRLRPAVGAVHHAHEVRRRRDQPELDRAVVQRPHADRGPRRRCARGSSPGRSPARSRSPPRTRATPGSSTRLMPNSTSCAVSGSPSDQRSPSRRWNT